MKIRLSSQVPSWIAFLVILLLLKIEALASSPQPELVLQNGHTSPVMSVAFSADGKTLATASIDGTAKIWDVPTGKLLATLNGDGDVLAVAFSPDGRSLATGSGSNTISLWDVQTGRRRMLLKGHTNAVWALCFSPDGRVLASGSMDGTARLWDAATGKVRAVLRGHSEAVRSVVFIVHGRTLVTGGGDRTVRFWDVASGKGRKTFIEHPTPIWSAAVSPDGRTLAVGGDDGQLKVWDIATGRLRASLEGHTHAVDSVAWRPDGRILASGDHFDGAAKLWNPTSGKLLAAFKGHTHGIHSLAFSPDGRILATGSDDTTTKMWSVPGGKVLASLSGRSAWVLSLAMSRDGRLLAAGYADHTARLWDLATGTLLTRPLSGDFEWVQAVTFIGDSRLIATGGGDGAVDLWDSDTGKKIRSLGERVVGQWDHVWCLAATPDGRILASGGDTLKLWDPDGGKLLAVLKGHSKAVRSAAFSPDGRILATGSEDGSLKLWNTSTGKVLATLEAGSEIFSVAFSPDGRTLAAGKRDGSVELWDTAARTFRAVLGRHSGWVYSVVFSPDGRLLATGSLDGTARLWDPATGKPLLTLTGHSAGVMSVVFSPGSPVLATGSSDSTIKFWHTATGKLLATALAFDQGKDWLVVSPEGFFDGTPTGMKRILWRLGGNIFETRAPEQYFNEFYQPGLLSDIVKKGKAIPETLRDRGDARASLTIAEKDRRLPGVSIKAPPHARSRLISVAVRISDPSSHASRSKSSGIRDVRLFRNGALVARWPGFRKPGTLTAKIPVVAGENLLSAYAFNRDQVKSKDANARVTGDSSLARKPRAYILAIGVSRYADSSYDLNYAAKDAVQTVEALMENLPFPQEMIRARTLLDERATRSNILASLRELSREVQPEDTVIVSYSGHGILHKGHFYLIPHDLGKTGDEPAIARHGIKDSDLEPIFMHLSAQQTALILDACHSGQALESDEWRRGPMNSRGLIQLAWEKGMEVLAASQSRQAALEAWEVGGRHIGHGLLTYALIEEGFASAPRRDGRLLARDWLDYAVFRVPQLLGRKDVKEKAIRLGSPGASPVQTPRVFHRREGGGGWTVGK